MLKSLFKGVFSFQKCICDHSWISSFFARDFNLPALWKHKILLKNSKVFWYQFIIWQNCRNRACERSEFFFILCSLISWLHPLPRSELLWAAPLFLLPRSTLHSDFTPSHWNRSPLAPEKKKTSLVYFKNHYTHICSMQECSEKDECTACFFIWNALCWTKYVITSCR